MSPKLIGVAVPGTNSTEVLANVEKAERLGIPAAWLTTRGAGLDPITLFAAAAVKTQHILLGTAIVPTYPRHPVMMGQQAQVLDQLAPGRFRLGVGPSHRPIMADIFGVDFRAPLGHLREYLRVLNPLLHEGAVDFEGRYYTAHARIGSPANVPVMASALQPKAFELCGAESDGAISWVCPWSYLRDVALPAMKSGAERAGRAVPPLIAHAPVCVHDNLEEARAAVREQITNPRLVFYQGMFAEAGFPEASNGTWSDGMLDAAAMLGNESQVTEKLEGLFALGAAEVLVSPIPAGADREASLDRTLRLVAKVTQSVVA
jgi:F420-dependent oxidoreductase-like protein